MKNSMIAMIAETIQAHELSGAHSILRLIVTEKIAPASGDSLTDPRLAGEVYGCDTRLSRSSHSRSV